VGIQGGAVQVRDVCGADDTVLAAIGVVMLGGESLREAYRFAALAAGRQLVNVGISVVDAAKRTACRSAG
jgi:bifunctional ADP-heptose synthase (sugar kinase/adenylyltransferase)